MAQILMSRRRCVVVVARSAAAVAMPGPSSAFHPSMKFVKQGCAGLIAFERIPPRHGAHGERDGIG
ncbi:hypothetical protein [uncultured Methylobacterium sp.]|uniref:hypothetical protein n=1 Tax=uncultured Methylobacterium sp. TaxID=157278 RepID=UPI0035C94506